MLNGAVRVLLVDDHALVRGSLAERLHRETGIDVVATADTAQRAIELVVESRPDIILMDIDMPGLNCFEAARRIAAVRPQTHLVFLSGFVSDRYVEQVLAVRARGYLTKGESPDAVVAAVREVASGGVCFSDEVRARVVVGSRGALPATPTRSRASALTPREVEVLTYIARGLAKKEIANTIAVSVKTVDTHTVRLMNKLDIHDRVELARFAIREGLVEP